MQQTLQESFAIDELHALLPGKVLVPHTAEFDQAIQLWNGAITKQPALVVLPETVADVQAAVGFARRHELPLTVLGGGHDWAGRALNEGGLVLSLRNMRRVKIDVGTQLATVDGGALTADLIAIAAQFKLVAVTGTVGVVGYAGLTLGGGYGSLNALFGLALDNVVRAELVLADGRAVVASATEHPDLFWAIRGGGGNFGVVTSLTVRLHPAKPIVGGTILFAWSEAAAVLRGYQKLMQSAPDEFSVQAGLLSAPDGQPMCFLAPTWYGDPQAAEPYLAALRQLGTPIMDQVATMQYGELLGMYDAYVAKGLHYELKTRWTTQLTEANIAAIVQAGTERSSPLSMLSIHPFHGAPTRVALDATAFGLRAPHYMVEIIATWDPADAVNAPRHQQWAADLSNALAKDALPGGYANLLGPEEHDQIAQAYGDNLQKLQAVKRT